MISGLIFWLQAGEEIVGGIGCRLHADVLPALPPALPHASGASTAQGATSEASSAALLTLASQRLFGLAGMVVPENTP